MTGQTTAAAGGAGGKKGVSADTMTAALTFFIGACICTFLFYAQPYLQPFETYRLVAAVVLLWIPYMAITLLMKQDVQQFGMTRGDAKAGRHYARLAILVMLPVLIIASLQSDFKRFYDGSLSQPLAMVGYAVRSDSTPMINWPGVAYYELITGFYMFCWEFFFRGFLLNGLARARMIGPTGAIILQTIPFTLLHWSVVAGASKPPLEIASAFFGGLILGWLAVKTRTFFYGFIIHWTISLIFDLLMIGSLLAVAHGR